MKDLNDCQWTIIHIFPVSLPVRKFSDATVIPTTHPSKSDSSLVVRRTKWEGRSGKAGIHPYTPARCVLTHNITDMQLNV